MIHIIENSELIKELLETMLSISGRKTTPSHATYVVESTIKTLKDQYSFLNDIGIQDTTFIEEGDQVTVMTNVNDISKNEFGSAIKDLLYGITESLGKDAGIYDASSEPTGYPYPEYGTHALWASGSQ